jgi:hypothetical protein
LHSRFWQELPQLESEAPGEHTPSPVQDPHEQVDWQVWVPQLPQP